MADGSRWWVEAARSCGRRRRRRRTKGGRESLGLRPEWWLSVGR